MMFDIFIFIVIDRLLSNSIVHEMFFTQFEIQQKITKFNTKQKKNGQVQVSFEQRFIMQSLRYQI